MATIEIQCMLCKEKWAGELYGGVIKIPQCKKCTPKKNVGYFLNIKDRTGIMVIFDTEKTTMEKGEE